MFSRRIIAFFAESHEVTQLECESRWFPYNRHLTSVHLEPHLAADQRIAVPGVFHFPHPEEPSGNKVPHSDGPTPWCVNIFAPRAAYSSFSPRCGSWSASSSSVIGCPGNGYILFHIPYAA